jgi:hypothetical protein
MKSQILLSILFLASSYCSFSQQENALQPGRDQALDIFLDCRQCDMEYFKTNFTAVNYVFDNHDADVHILVSALPTGGGGREYTIRYIGQGIYSHMIDTNIFNLPEYVTSDETRKALLDRIRLGLVPFLLKTSYSEKLTLFIDRYRKSRQIPGGTGCLIFQVQDRSTNKNTI